MRSRTVTTPPDRTPWWAGARGEWLVVVQVALIGLVFFGPRSLPGDAGWVFAAPPLLRVLAVALMVSGTALLLTALVRLGPGLTPLPYPKRGGRLVVTGPYTLVRHPMYSGGLVLALGWALFIDSWLTLAYVVILFVFLDAKSRREERWLAEKFPEYRAYQRRVRKLIPLVY